MLLDTSGLLCLHHKAEPYHAVSCDLYRGSTRRLTHSYILAEYLALANARRLPRVVTVAFVSDLIDDPEIETIWVDEMLHREALALLKARPDKSYSHCDAVSFVLMRHRDIREALTTDRHFEQEGFRRLLA